VIFGIYRNVRKNLLALMVVRVRRTVGGICPFSNRAAPISAKTVTVEIDTHAPPQLRQHYFLLLMNSTFTFLAVEYYYSKPQIVSPSPH
jgi:hypothetical protein